jgi:hypothetical protein
VIIHKEYKLNIDKLQCSKMFKKRERFELIKYIFTTIITIVFIAVILFFKPVTIFFAEKYTGTLLEKKVKITSLSFYPLKAQAYIQEPTNIIDADVKGISPLRVLARYKGDLSAFEIYQPLKGHAEALASISYDEKLLIDGKLSAYGSKTKVTVKQLEDSWYVYTDAKGLKVEKLLHENNQDLKQKADVDFELKLNIDANNALYYKILSTIKHPDFYKTKLDINGTYKSDLVKANTKIAFKDSTIDIDKLNFHTRKLQISLHSSSFGGDLHLSYANDLLDYELKRVHLSKLFKVAEQKPIAKGEIDLVGKLNTKDMSTNFSFYSPLIIADGQKIEELKVVVPSLTYKTDMIQADANIKYQHLDLDINNLHLNLKDFHTSLDTDSFGGKLNLSYQDETLYYDAKKLHLSKVLKASKQKPLARGYINLRGKLNTKDFKTDFVFSSPKITTATQNLQNIKLLIPNLQYRDKKVSASYKLDATFLEKAFNFNGDISYKDTLHLSAKSNDFNSTSEFYLDDSRYKLSMRGVNISELLSFASQKPYADGSITLDASGDFNEVNFKINSDALVKEHKIKLTTNGSYNIKSKLLNSDFKASVPLEKDSFEVHGSAKFKERLSLEAYSSSFESQTVLKLNDKYFKLKIDDINLAKLTKAPRAKLFLALSEKIISFAILFLFLNQLFRRCHQLLILKISLRQEKLHFLHIFQIELHFHLLTL